MEWTMYISEEVCHRQHRERAQWDSAVARALERHEQVVSAAESQQRRRRKGTRGKDYVRIALALNLIGTHVDHRMRANVLADYLEPSESTLDEITALTNTSSQVNPIPKGRVPGERSLY